MPPLRGILVPGGTGGCTNPAIKETANTPLQCPGIGSEGKGRENISLALPQVFTRLAPARWLQTPCGLSFRC